MGEGTRRPHRGPGSVATLLGDTTDLRFVPHIAWMKSAPAAAPAHGAPALTAVVVETYNAELRDSEGFIGDRASNRAFRAILDDLRDRLRAVGEHPLARRRPTS